MSLDSHAGQEELDTAKRGNLGLVGSALGGKVFGLAVENVNVALGNVHVAEKVVVHKVMVALVVGGRQAAVLVHVEGHHVSERKAVLVGLHQTPIHSLGRRTGGQTKHKRLVGAGSKLRDSVNHKLGHVGTSFVGRGEKLGDHVGWILSVVIERAVCVDIQSDVSQSVS